MKRNWVKEELEQPWTLFEREHKLLKNKAGANLLSFTVLMKFFQITGRFPDDSGEVPRDVIRFVAWQLEVPIRAWHGMIILGADVQPNITEVKYEIFSGIVRPLKKI
jgi:hypothetical protein